MAASDFYDVQLSAAGAKLGQVRVTGTHIDYTFKPGQPVRVLTSEWRKILARQRAAGAPLLEIATKAVAAAAQPTAPAAPVPQAAQSKTVPGAPPQAPEAEDVELKTAKSTSTKGGN